MLILFFSKASAQDYIFAPMALNPASTGNSENLRISTNYTIVKDYQSYFLFTADAPVTKNGNLALGIQANVYENNEIAHSLTEQKYFVGSIAYRIKLKGESYLALGAQGMSVFNIFFNENYTPNAKTITKFRVGVGANLYGRRGDLGISIPYFYETSSPFNIHGNILTDNLGKNTFLKFSAVVSHQPMGIFKTKLDVGATLYRKKLGIGVWANRVGEGSSLYSTYTLDYTFLNNLKLGFSYTPRPVFNFIQIHAKYDFRIYNREVKRRYF